MKLSLALLSLAVLAAPRTAAAQNDESPPAPPAASPSEEPPPEEGKNRPRRSGFTMELGLGASFMSVDSVKNVESNKFGLAPLSLGLGGFLSRDVALTFRATGTSLFQDRGRGLEQVILGFYGGSLQYYVSDNLYLGAGVGLGLVAGSPVSSSAGAKESIVPRAGLALQGRVGWAFYTGRAHQFSVMTEVIPARVEGANAVGATLALGWQFY